MDVLNLKITNFYRLRSHNVIILPRFMILNVRNKKCVEYAVVRMFASAPTGPKSSPGTVRNFNVIISYAKISNPQTRRLGGVKLLTTKLCIKFNMG